MALVKGADLVFETVNQAQTEGREPIRFGMRDPEDGFQCLNHFVQAVPNGATSEFVIGSLAGAGAAATITAGTSRRGVAVFNTGTTAGGRAGVISSATPLLIPSGAAVYAFKASFRIPVLSTGAESFVCRFGFGDTTAGNSTDGAWFQIESDVDPTIYAYTSNGGVSTNVDTNFTIVADTDYLLEIVLTASTASFYINDALVATIATNLPAGAAAFGVHSGIQKTVGTTARTMEQDFIWLDVRN